MTEPVLLESNKLILREYQPSDLQAIHSYASDENAVQFMIWGPNTLVETKKFLSEAIGKGKQEPRMSYELCIESKMSKQVIGGCGLYIKDSNRQLAEIGYIIHPNSWGQGFATEATKSLVIFGMKELGIPVIQASCDLKNIGSRRVLEKSGFVLIKTYENHFKQKGIMRSTLLFKYEA